MLLCKLKYSMVRKIFSRMMITRTISQVSAALLLAEILMLEVCFSNGDLCDIRGKENCYRYFVISHGIKFEWKDAHGKCKDKNSSLPIIRNREEQTAFETHLRRLNNSKALSSSAVWTAGKRKTLNEWTWINNGHTLGHSISRINDSAYKTHAIIEWSHRGNITMKPKNPWKSALSLCQHRDRQCNGQQHEVNATNGCLIPSEYGNVSWYGARNECLSKGGDLAILTYQDLQNLTNHRFPNYKYWIGLRKEYWFWQTDRGSQASSEEEVKYTNWARQQMPIDGELCISINASNGQWIATVCSTKASSVLCEKRASTTTNSIPRMSSATAATARNSPTPTTTIAATINNHKDVSSVTATTKTNAENGIATSTTTAAVNYLTATATNDATTAYATIGTGAVVIVILCIVVIMVVIWRKSKSSNNQMEPAQTDSKTMKDKKTKENQATATTEERSIYADIPMAEKTANDAPETGQKGTVYASLDFNQGLTYAEPSKLYAVTENTQDVSGPIYTEPFNATGNGSTSAGSFPAVKTGPMGDVYALPTTNVTPFSAKMTERPIYANT